MTIRKFSDRDDFNREVFAEIVIDLLNNKHISPMIIDGEWGSGKTEFSLKLESKLKEENLHISTDSQPLVLRIDAFNEEYYNNPISGLLIELYKQLSSEFHLESEEIKINILDILGDLEKCGLSRVSGKFFGKLVAYKTGCDISEIISGFFDFICAYFKKLKKSINNELNKERERPKNIRDKIQEVISKITANRTLYILVDEVDRCSPRFSLRVIESLKYFIDLDDRKNLNVIVLANMKQLYFSVSKEYGTDSEGARRYFNKFFRAILKLPTQVQRKDHAEYEKSSAALKLFRLKFNNFIKFDVEEEKEAFLVIGKIIDHYQMTLRDVERAYDYFEIYNSLGFYKNNDNIFLMYLILSKIANKSMEYLYDTNINSINAVFDEICEIADGLYICDVYRHMVLQDKNVNDEPKFYINYHGNLPDYGYIIQDFKNFNELVD